MPMQAQPQHQQPAMPEPLTGLPQEQPAHDQLSARPPWETAPPTRAQPAINSGNSAFAQPQPLASEMDEALNLAMNLDTK